MTTETRGLKTSSLDAYLNDRGPSTQAGNPSKRLITGPELAEYLGVNVRTVWLLGRRGQVPRIVVGRSVRFDFDAVMKALGKNEDDVL